MNTGLERFIGVARQLDFGGPGVPIESFRSSIEGIDTDPELLSFFQEISACLAVELELVRVGGSVTRCCVSPLKPTCVVSGIVPGDFEIRSEGRVVWKESLGVQDVLLDGEIMLAASDRLFEDSMSREWVLQSPSISIALLPRRGGGRLRVTWNET